MWERAGRREKDDPPAMEQARRNLVDGKMLATAIIKEGNLKEAAQSVGLSTTKARQLMQIPAVSDEIEEGLSIAARRAGVSKEWLLKKLVDIVDRCMQVVQVYDNDGEPTGEYEFDSRGATKALELIGKHLRAFGEDDTNAATKVGQAVIRLLAQEAQAGRLAQSVGVVDVPLSGNESGPIQSGPSEGTTLAPGKACDHPAETHTASPPNPAAKEALPHAPPSG